VEDASKLLSENALREAFARDEFVLHYQPKVDVDTRRIVGLEGLLRWRSPALGLVPPKRFIPILERSGLILDVGRWALRRAMLDQSAWARDGIEVPRIAINVSAVQLRHANFVAAVIDAISGSSMIDIEITESRIMEDVAANVGKLRQLRNAGVRIAVDDFGTGYSSLSYLGKLPLHAVKIDRVFINGMLHDDDMMTLVQGIISIAQPLKLSTIAEGVETEEEADMLGLLRCDEMQGFLISKPLPEEEIRAHLQRAGAKS
jgi:EAL domain-containing protein (putative c-di-GMP-specific phosphodiesterase class I)